MGRLDWAMAGFVVGVGAAVVLLGVEVLLGLAVDLVAGLVSRWKGRR